MVPSFSGEVLVIATGMALSIAVYLITRWVKNRAALTTSQLDDLIVMAVQGPAIIVIQVITWYLVIKDYTTLPQTAPWLFEGQYLLCIWVILGAWIISRFSYNFLVLYGKVLAARTESDLDDKLVDFLVLSVKYIVWFAATLIILYLLQINITPFLAGAGILGIVIGLASQDILSNFFGGAIITIDRPFDIGDRVQIDNYIGDVVAIGPRSIRIRSLDAEYITIPNRIVTGTVVVNHAMPDEQLKVRFPLSVAYGTDIRRVKKILEEIVRETAAEVPAVLADPPPEIYFLEFGTSGLQLLMHVWARDCRDKWLVQDAVNTRIRERFCREGIEIPYQTVDVNMRHVIGDSPEGG